jgi:hypothetical protein
MNKNTIYIPLELITLASFIDGKTTTVSYAISGVISQTKLILNFNS